MASTAMPPGPRRTPPLLLAARFQFTPLKLYPALRERYGDIFTVRFPVYGRVVYVAHPDLVKQVFAGDPQTMHAGEANASVLEPAVGPNSVLTLDEDEHLRQRRLLLPPFHGEAIRRYAQVVEEVAARNVSTWRPGSAFALRTQTQAITLEVILRAVFGLRDGERLARGHEVVAEFAHRANLVLIMPFLRRDLGRFSPWTRFVRAREALDAFIGEEIALRRAAPDALEREDVLSLLLRAEHEDGSPMTDAELRDELVTVIGAGHETTATSLAWAVERLLSNPHVLERLRDSLAAGEEDYLEAVVKETLRVRPVISEVGRELKHPFEIAGYTIPAGIPLLPAIVAMHYREDFFPQPHEFRPERFLEGRDPAGWIPFGGGVRRCVGAAFAQLEMRIVLREIVERAELRLERGPERPVIRNITIAPARGTRVVLERPVPPAREHAFAGAVAA